MYHLWCVNESYGCFCVIVICLYSVMFFFVSGSKANLFLKRTELPVPPTRDRKIACRILNHKCWFSVRLYRPKVTPSPLERGQGVCEFSLIDRKITHPLSPLERGNRYSRHYNHKYEIHPKRCMAMHLYSCRGLSFAVCFSWRLIKMGAKPLPLWALAPLINICR